MRIIYIIAGIICMHSMCYAQPVMTLDSQQVKQLRAFQARYEFLDSAYPAAVKEIAIDDSLLKVDSNQIANQQAQIFRLEETVYMLKNQTTPLKIPSLFEWQGFHVGLSAQYNFEDSILTRATIIGGMKYAIEGIAGVILAAKVLLQGTIGIPFKEKFYVKAYAGWRLF